MLPLISTLVHAQIPYWQQHTTKDFNVISDLARDKALDLIERVELFDHIARDYLGTEANPASPPLNLLIFARRKDFAQLVERRHFAAFTQPGLAATLLVIGPSTGSASLLANTLHEYTHYLLRTQPVSYPVWYEEGLATLLGTSKFDRIKHTVTVGRFADHRPLPQREPFSMKLGTIVDTKDITGWRLTRLTQFYRQSAQLVHFFLYGPQRKYPDYRRALGAFFANREASLFVSLNTPEKTLARQWQRYLRARTLPYETLAITATTTQPDSTTLSSADAKVWHARAAEIPNPQRAIELYQELLQDEPDNVIIRVDLVRVLMDVDLDQAAQVLSIAINQSPHDPGVLVQQASVMMRQCPLTAELKCLARWQMAARLSRRALSKNPTRHDAILQLGITELYTGNPGRAIDYLRIAHQRVPWSPKVNLHLGECLRLLGNSKAEHFLRQARDWAYGKLVRDLAIAALARIPHAEIEQ